MGDSAQNTKIKGFTNRYKRGYTHIPSMIKKVIFTLFLFFFCFASNVNAASYYVDKSNLGGTCNDSNSGTQSSPWCTVSKAATTMVAGDTTYIRTGIYRETLTPTNSGSSGSPITYKNFDSETATISGADLVTNWISLGGVESTGVFSTGFETGGTSDFTSTTADSGNTVAVDTTIKSHGSYSLKASFGGTNENARANKTISSQTNVYARLYFYLSSDFAIPSADQRVDLMLLREGTTATHLRLAVLRNSSNQYYIKVDQLYPSTTAIYAGTAGEITKENWHYVELNYKVDASVGGSQVWLDGTSKGSNFATNTSGSVISRVEIGGNSAGQVAPSGGAIYMDDFRVNTSQNGAFTAEGDSTIYRASGVNWTVGEVYENDTKLTSKDSVANITGSGQWYYDTTPNYLYLRSLTDTDPDNVTIDVPNRSQAAVFSSHSYITLDGLTLKHARQSGQAGVKLTSSNNIIIKNSIVEKNAGSGIYLITSDNNTIQNNIIRSNYRQFGGGIRLENGSDNNQILTNTITGDGLSGGNGMTLCGDSSCGSDGNDNNLISGNTMSNFYDTCAYFDTNNNGNIVEKNRCYDVYRQSDSQGGNGIHLALGSSNNIVRNNIIHDLERHGISIRSDDVYNSTGNKIYNNTIYNTGSTSGSCINVQGTNTGIEIYNNIAYKAAARALNVEANSIGGVTSDYNLFFNDGSSQLITWGNDSFSSLKDFQSRIGQDLHSYQENPVFVSIGSDDYRVQSNSLAINRGNNISVSDDYAGTLRPRYSIFDIGAYESDYGTSSTDPRLTNFVPEAPKCAENQKIYSANIFQVRKIGGKTRVYFTPPKGKYDRFYIYVSKTKDTNKSYAGQTVHSNFSGGVLSADFVGLKKGTNYFSVQTAYSCYFGDRSIPFKITL